ncbi:hypothetical protein [Desulfolutivibrio sp.]|uniref:hypothetical protein n=1 Tax=Desulfolutivibrio sp. TaxID=2773296 RepID=UPI002F96E438
MSEPLPLFPETYGFVPLLEKVRASVQADVARVEASGSGVLAESRRMAPQPAASGGVAAPGELSTGRVADAEA